MHVCTNCRRGAGRGACSSTPFEIPQLPGIPTLSLLSCQRACRSDRRQMRNVCRLRTALWLRDRRSADANMAHLIHTGSIAGATWGWEWSQTSATMYAWPKPGPCFRSRSSFISGRGLSSPGGQGNESRAKTPVTHDSKHGPSSSQETFFLCS